MKTREPVTTGSEGTQLAELASLVAHEGETLVRGLIRYDADRAQDTEQRARELLNELSNLPDAALLGAAFFWNRHVALGLHDADERQARATAVELVRKALALDPSLQFTSQFVRFVLVGGGCSDEGLAHFGKVVSKVPVHRLTDAVDRLLALYREHREGDEELGAFFRRVPPSMATDALKDLAQLLPNEIGEQDLIDLGENQAFNPEVMDGECSA